MAGGPFDKAVILVLEQNSYNTFGLVLNNPPKQGTYPAGGPVEPDAYYTIHSLDLSAHNTVQIADMDMGYTKGDTFLLLIRQMGDKPREHITFRGYTSWPRGQMLSEIEMGKWRVVDFNARLVFHTSPAEMWNVGTHLPDAKPDHSTILSRILLP